MISLAIGAPDLSACARNTHTYAGEADHTVLGQNRVSYTSWWASLGQAEDLVILSCDTGEAVSVRMNEYDMTPDSPFERKAEALEMLAKMEATGFLFTLDQVEDHYTKKRFKSERVSIEEACACKVLKEAK